MPPMPGAAPMGGEQKKPKFDPLMLDYRMYNIQQQITAIMNALKIDLPPDALIMPPGSMGAPPAESAMPGMGGPVDAATQGGQAQPQPGAEQQSAISPIEGIQPAMPQSAAPAAPAKTAAAQFGAAVAEAALGDPGIEIVDTPPPADWWHEPEMPKAASYIGDPVAREQINTAAALAARLRSHAAANAHQAA